jgi:hypothetical protein
MNSHDVIPFLMFGGFFVLMAVIITASVLYARKRTRELAEVAQRIGFQFMGTDVARRSRPNPRSRCCSALVEDSATS